MANEADAVAAGRFVNGWRTGSERGQTAVARAFARTPLALVAVIALVSTGCTALSFRQEAPEPSVPEPTLGTDLSSQQVALDFVNAIRQIEALAPEQTVLQFVNGGNDEPVLVALREMLAQSGYAIRRVATRESAERLVTHRVVAADGSARQHEVSVGDIGLRRAYRALGTGRVRPASALLVKGADANAIRMMDDVLFGLEQPDDGMDGTAEGRSGGAPAGPTLPGQLLASYGHLLAAAEEAPADEVLRRVSDAPPLVSTAAGGDVAAAATGDGGGSAIELAPVRNVRELGRSNYADTLAGTSVVVDHVMGFPRGSVRLDAADVTLIDEVIDRFDAGTDVIALAGYSLGGSAGVEFNRRMALRRAQRVKEALTAVGIPSGQVLVEGFWADEPVADEPNRAVRMRLLRRAPS